MTQQAKQITIGVVIVCLVALGLWKRSQITYDHLSENVVSHQPISQEPIQPIPLNIALSAPKVTLGDRLFHDPRLSKNDRISCASCHNLKTGGTDRRPLSMGLNNQLADRNAPTVFNSSFNFKQFWDGRAETLEDQIDGPVHNPKEMGTNWPEIIQKLKQDAYYTTAFGDIYTDGIQVKNIKDAIATFERSLYTPNAPFDRYLRGSQTALSSEELEGYKRFKSYGCISCHQGVGVGGNMFETSGVMAGHLTNNTNPTPKDPGRLNLTGDEKDFHVFKVPGLRNVAITAPYFHDGSAPTLEDAVQKMGRFQIGRELPPKDIQLIVKFLHTLTGEYQGASL